MNTYDVVPAGRKPGSIKKSLCGWAPDNGSPGRRLLFIPLLLSIWLSTPLQADSQVFFSATEAVQPRIIEAIDSCHQTLDIAMYDFSSKPLLKALKRASERGVKVRVLLDRNVIQAHSKLYDGLPRIQFRTLAGRNNGRKGLMHNKFAIFDNNRIETGSYNWTQGAEINNFENALFEDDPSVASAYIRQFETLWAKGRSYKVNSGTNSSHRHGKNSMTWLKLH
jgi:phosphatidylserine/phosphatidylglycerophosphate/cardiolipin synthase-like enzyme